MINRQEFKDWQGDQVTLAFFNSVLTLKEKVLVELRTRDTDVLQFTSGYIQALNDICNTDYGDIDES